MYIGDQNSVIYIFYNIKNTRDVNDRGQPVPSIFYSFSRANKYHYLF